MPVDLGNKTLLKIGIHRPCRLWLSGLQAYALVNRGYRLFDCGGTKSLTMAKYKGDIYNPTTGQVEHCLFYEKPQQLIEMTDSYNLLCKLEYVLGGHNLETGGWNPIQMEAGRAWDDQSGEYSWPNSPGTDILANTNWVYGTLVSPDIPIAPYPAPAANTEIGLLETTDGSQIAGYVKFWTNPGDGKLNFVGTVYWTCTTQTKCQFTFPVPNCGRWVPFTVSGSCPQQVLNGTVSRWGTDTLDSLTTNTWTGGPGTFKFRFEKFNIDIAPPVDPD